MRTELATSLKRTTRQILEHVEKTREPVMITQDGLPTAYLVDVETWESLIERVELLEGIARGERSIEARRTATHAQARKRLARWLK